MTTPTGTSRTSTFRWDITRKEQLTRRLKDVGQWPYQGFLEELRSCSASLLGQSQGAELIFLGRSPESFFDYLTGCLQETPWADRCKMLNVSFRGCIGAHEQYRMIDPEGLERIYQQFRRVGVSPAQLLARRDHIAFVDLVCEGLTFGHLWRFLKNWARVEGYGKSQIRQMQQMIRFVGIVERSKSSPKAWRWWQRCDWASEVASGAIKNTSVSPRFWRYLGNVQVKLCKTNPACTWSVGEPEKKPYSGDLAQALWLARALYETGVSRRERKALGAEITSQPAIKEGWCRQLVSALNGKPKSKAARRRKGNGSRSRIHRR